MTNNKIHEVEGLRHMADYNSTSGDHVKLEDNRTVDTHPVTVNSSGAAAPAGVDNGATPKAVRRIGDRVFETLSTASATLITVFIAAIGIFLVLRAIPALNRNANGFLGFFTYTDTWNTSDVENMYFGIPNLFAATVMMSVLALIIAMPIALGVAIFLSNYAPKSIVKPMGYLVDMLAAVPSIVYGLWGWLVLGPFLSGFYKWI